VVNKDPHEQNWDKSREIVRTCGLPPAAQLILHLRGLIDDEIDNDAPAGHEYLRSLCALLWSNGDPDDSVRIAKAKFLSFDAGCMIDSDFLVCGSLAAARKVLAASDHPSAKKAVEWIADWPEISVQDLKERIVRERRYFDLGD
jgi:hypothetical protein